MAVPPWHILFYKHQRSDGTTSQPVADFFASEVTDAERGQFQTRLQYLQMYGLQTLSKKPDVLETLSGEKGLYALRLDNTPNNPRVLLCTQVGRTFVLLHAFKEKSSRDYRKAIRIARERQDRLSSSPS